MNQLWLNRFSPFEEEKSGKPLKILVQGNVDTPQQRRQDNKRQTEELGGMGCNIMDLILLDLAREGRIKIEGDMITLTVK